MTAPSPAPARKPRRDAFDGDRRRVFLKALKKCACVSDAARKAGVSRQTVYNHQAADPGFARQCDLALEFAGTDVELHAWERGVTGVKEPVFDRAGEIVGYRLKRSDNILRLLLQGANRKKYGPNPGFTRKRLYRFERKKIRAEVDAERRERQRACQDEVDRELMKRLDDLARTQRARKRKEGWTELEGDEWVPPGWVRAPGWAALADPDAPAQVLAEPERERGEPTMRFV